MPLQVRIPAIERLLGVSLAAIDEEALRRLVGAEETQHLEFKEVPGEIWADRAEVAKDICAFANAAGGLIAYGISESGGNKGVATELKPFARPTGDLRQRLTQILMSHCRPAPGVDVAFVEAAAEGDLGYVLVAVPRSADAPHARTSGKPNDLAMQFPMRYENTTVFLSEGQLAERYRVRFDEAAQREERCRSLAREMHAEHETPMDFQLSGAVVPVNAGRFELTSTDPRQLRDRLHRATWPIHCGQLIDGLSTHVFRTGMLEISAGAERMRFHRDGSMSLRRTFGNETNLPDLSRIPQNPTGVSEWSLLTSVISSLQLAASFASHEAGSSGDLLVTIRIDSWTQQRTRREMTLVRKNYPAYGMHLPAGDHVVNEVHIETQMDIALGWSRCSVGD
jgi:Putative DNA-binding domain